jgi:hypothetical protein
MKVCLDDAGTVPGDATPGCTYGDPTKTYYGKSVAACATIRFVCPDSAVMFTDSRGCGCQTAPASPCAGKQCGETCSTCLPGQVCAAVIEYCNNQQQCVATMPACPF